ncbi:hypothetical protein CRENBAI_020112 [Crenichthys baileyi]|uniref:Uncharacterized protein n=1 Tax=Crenichthys baileyi TaxID=28760 RepID=A0AAV9SK86_9TELE
MTLLPPPFPKFREGFDDEQPPSPETPHRLHHCKSSQPHLLSTWLHYEFQLRSTGPCQWFLLPSPKLHPGSKFSAVTLQTGFPEGPLCSAATFLVADLLKRFTEGPLCSAASFLVADLLKGFPEGPLCFAASFLEADLQKGFSEDPLRSADNLLHTFSVAADLLGAFSAPADLHGTFSAAADLWDSLFMGSSYTATIKASL